MTPRDYDKHIYKERHLVECFFCKIKEFRRIATRYEKLKITFLTMIFIAACLGPVSKKNLDKNPIHVMLPV